jgi:hypothetical protein
MEESGNHEISVTVTCQRLVSLAECSCRMTGYADPDGKRLITVLQSLDGTLVRLVLDRSCIATDCIKTGASHTCTLKALRACRNMQNLKVRRRTIRSNSMTTVYPFTVRSKEKARSEEHS